jgi:hypothetical protein
MRVETVCALSRLAVVLLLSSPSDSVEAATQSADDRPAAQCLAYEQPVFRLFAIGGLFPVPNYLAVNPLPGSSVVPETTSLARLPDSLLGETAGRIAFAQVSYAMGLQAAPDDLDKHATEVWRSTAGGITVTAYRRSGERQVAGVPVNSVVVVFGHNSRLDFYGDQIEDEVTSLVNLFMAASDECLRP